MYNLGIFYQNGLGGLRQNVAKAAVLFAQAEALEREKEEKESSLATSKSKVACQHCAEVGWNEKDLPEPPKVKPNPRYTQKI